MITCGWCNATTHEGLCESCGRDAAQPWIQRGRSAPVIETEAGRPSLDVPTIRRRLSAAQRAVEQRGAAVTVERLAEELDVSPRTVRRWREMAG